MSEVTDVIDVIIADDQTLVRRGIRSLLELSGDFAVIAEASDGRAQREVLRNPHRSHPTLAQGAGEPNVRGDHHAGFGLGHGASRGYHSLCQRMRDCSGRCNFFAARKAIGWHSKRLLTHLADNSA